MWNGPKNCQYLNCVRSDSIIQYREVLSIGSSWACISHGTAGEIVQIQPKPTFCTIWSVLTSKPQPNRTSSGNSPFERKRRSLGPRANWYGAKDAWLRERRLYLYVLTEIHPCHWTSFKNLTGLKNCKVSSKYISPL